MNKVIFALSLSLFPATSVYAAGGSQQGAVACAAVLSNAERGFTHVERSVRDNHTIEEFWLSAGDEASAYCRYDRVKNEVRLAEIDSRPARIARKDRN